DSANLMHRYTTERVLADALYGQVLLCRDNITGEQVAIKRMNVAAATAKTMIHTASIQVSEDIAFEKRVHRALSVGGGHCNVLRLRSDFVEDGFDHFVLDYCVGGELFDLMDSMPDQRLDMDMARRYFRQILHGVQFMHARGFAHRDLSLENVLVDGKDNCYICDFGLATFADAPSQDTVGKAFYMAPEVAVVTRGASYDPVKADIWSLGIMLFMMLTGSPLVEMASVKDSRYRYLQTQGLPRLVDAWRVGHAVHGDALDLLQRMLCRNPASRLSLQAVLDHPFVSQLAVPSSSLTKCLGGFFKKRARRTVLDVYSATMM
ncbi:hypothetical protein DYB37_007051, partial [Aphanomyces astaci]